MPCSGSQGEAEAQGSHCLTRNSFNNSPEFWRLFLDVRAKEKRGKD